MEKQERSPYSSDGYIVDQARLTTIRYGAFTSDVNGCGWIAAFNFLRRRGEDVSERAVADELIRWSLLRGLAGTSLFRLKRMLRRHGYDAALKIVSKKRAALPDGTQAGVLYYCHKDGLHFVAFCAAEDGSAAENGPPRYRYFNAIPGWENHTDTMRGFLQKHNVLPLAGALVWPRGKDAPSGGEEVR